MRLTFVFILLVISLLGCSKKRVQYFITSAPALHSSGDTYIFENDTVAVEYSFWANKGIMSFAVYNKLDKPIYIDWKKSSLILNGLKLNYWSDDINTSVKTSTISASTQTPFIYNGPIIRPFAISYGAQTSLSVSEGVISKQERITFLPPKSNFFSSRHHIISSGFTDWGTDYIKEEVARNGGPKSKMTTIFSKQFTEQNSPVVFRNFLSLSTTESFDKEFYVDNAFHVKEVKSMEKKHFVVDSMTNYDTYVPVYMFNKGVDFYWDKH